MDFQQFGGTQYLSYYLREEASNYNLDQVSPIKLHQDLPTTVHTFVFNMKLLCLLLYPISICI